MTLENLMRREAKRVLDGKQPPLMGIVSAYDPAKYAAKVILQPDGVETGFLQVGTEWIGMYAPPDVGEVVEVQFQEWGRGAPYLTKRFYGSKFPPRPVPAGEFHLYHKSGSTFRLTNDGRATVADRTGASLTFNADGSMIVNANLIVNGMMQATGDIIDNTATNPNTMASFRRLYDEHRHNAPDGVTSPPLAPDIL